MPKSRSMSKSAPKKGSTVTGPPPPPPTLIRVNTPAEFATHVTDFRGGALLAVVGPLCPASTGTVVPFLERLNAERPPLLQDTKLLVLYATDESRELCQQLQVSTLPCFFAYSLGELVAQFSGDNVPKAELIAKVAAQKTVEEIARLDAEKKAMEQDGAGNGVAAPA